MVIKIFERFNQQNETTVIMVTHDMGCANRRTSVEPTRRNTGFLGCTQSFDKRLGARRQIGLKDGEIEFDQRKSK
jgi:ABC-type lipoprotein export system ATPase subunit